MDNFTRLLTNILGCGVEELDLLKNVKGDWDYIIRNHLEGGASFDSLMRAACGYGIARIDGFIKSEIAIGNAENEKDKLAALERLCPWDDIAVEVNGAATDAYLIMNSDIYRKYLPDAIEEFERITGVDMYC